jgi:uncharacterized protein YqjF (DUF2071 family)
MSDYKPEQCWASHLPALFSCLLATSGAVLEVGAGDWSTPLLRKFCEVAGREFYSLEENEAWAAKCGSKFVALAGMTSSLFTAARAEQWSVVFLDHNGHRRAADALLFVDSAEYIVIHDYPAPEIFDSLELDRWKHHIVDKRARPWTLVLTQSDELAARLWQ